MEVSTFILSASSQSCFTSPSKSIKFKLFLVPDFDEYFQSLRPVMEQVMCNKSYGANYNEGDKQINCRNIWFREFWKQHHKCVFTPEEDELVDNFCTGKESIHNYEEEGLVPFVGKLLKIIFLIVCVSKPLLLKKK